MSRSEQRNQPQVAFLRACVGQTILARAPLMAGDASPQTSIDTGEELRLGPVLRRASPQREGRIDFGAKHQTNREQKEPQLECDRRSNDAKDCVRRTAERSQVHAEQQRCH